MTFNLTCNFCLINLSSNLNPFKQTQNASSKFLGVFRPTECPPFTWTTLKFCLHVHHIRSSHGFHRKERNHEKPQEQLWSAKPYREERLSQEPGTSNAIWQFQRRQEGFIRAHFREMLEQRRLVVFSFVLFNQLSLFFYTSLLRFMLLLAL